MNTQTFYIAPSGNDKWSGIIAEPNPENKDGPFATITHARDVVRNLAQNGDLAGPVTVYLRGGRYYINSPIIFTPEDSGPVTYVAYPGENPVIDGSKLIKGWRTEQLNGREVWVADCDNFQYFRQLFVNGKRRHRARLPKVEINHPRASKMIEGQPQESFLRIEDVPGFSYKNELMDGTKSFVVKEGDFHQWQHLEDIEVVILHYWIEERMQVASFEPVSRFVTCKYRSTFVLKDDFVDRWAKYYIDNVMEGLTDPGEWYLEKISKDKLKLYYIPMPGETLNTVEVVAPQIEQFVLFRGDPEKNRFVENIRFEDITFEYTDWKPQPWINIADPHDINIPPEFTAAPQAATNIPGTIQIEGARNCTIEKCIVQHIGYYAIEVKYGCRGIHLIGNELTDMGAGGIQIYGADAHSARVRLTGNNIISDNTIHQGGRVFHSGIGILSRDSFGNRITHNHIHDFYYSGISCGWVWGYRESVSWQNTIEKNHIHDLGHGWLSDMGGVYMLGPQPDTRVQGNLIHDIEKANYGGWGLYTDEGSTGVVLENNVVYNTNAQLFHQHYGHENIVRNNILAFGGEAAVALSRYDGVQAFTFERNIVITKDAPLFIGGYANIYGQGTIFSDLNLFWSPSEASLKVQKVLNGPLQTFTEWQSAGYDQHSIVADPMLKSIDINKFDWNLGDNSPALALGFKPIDLSDVGPRPPYVR
jgi:hypothetical protein